MVGPILIDKLEVEHFSAEALETMKNKLKLMRHSQVVKEILSCWVAMASANAICFSSYIRNYAEVDKKLYDLGKALVKVRNTLSTLCLHFLAYTLFQGFPDLFKTRPSLHALQHLGQHARRFGTLRNVSVSCKEMKHRIFKSVAPSTNKRDLPRDLASYESTMQSLRFVAAGWQDPQFPAVVGSGLRELFQSGVFESSYIYIVEIAAAVFAIARLHAKQPLCEQFSCLVNSSPLLRHDTSTIFTEAPRRCQNPSRISQY